MYLNEFDQEMVSRGVAVIRYADDIVVLAHSKRAALRLRESSQKYLEQKLKLQVNPDKSKVVRILSQKQFKFLGFAMGKNGTGYYIRAHRQSLHKAKKHLKALTRRNRGRSFRMVMQEVKIFLRGWLGYYYIADIKRILQDWNQWLYVA